MVVNSARWTKSFSRVEHVERVVLWKKIERFMAGWFAARMPRSFHAHFNAKAIFQRI